jgi:16S rRNA (cytosine967-C5)-methyltransferase
LSAPGLPARAAAAALVSGVLDAGRSLAEQGDGPLAGLTGPERARAQGLAASVLRHLGRIDATLAHHLQKPPPPPARHALRLAVAEIFLDGVPPHAAVDCAVRLARSDPKARRLAGLVNAVGRRAAESPEVWAGAAEAAPPPWLAKPLRAAWGEAALEAVRSAHLAPAPIDLTPRDPGDARALADRLGAELLPTGSLRLPGAPQITALPGYAEGAWWVQDAAAALPVRLFGDVAGRAALDLCAAPGGKTLQLAAAGAEVTAVDVSAHRLKRLEENLARTRLAARVVAADLLAWEPRDPAEVVLLDAPCTASGTIRRHPDLPHLKGDRDLRRLAELQTALLARAWDWVAPGGALVYAVCSLLPVEGEARAAAFAAAHPEARRVPANAAALGVPADWIDGEGALRTRPDYWAGRGGVDGFYAVRFDKPA